MIMRWFTLFLLVFVMEEGFAQHKKIEYSGYLSFGVNTPMNDKKNTGELSFIDIGSATSGNLGVMLGGAIYYKKIGFNFGLEYYKYEMDISNYQQDIQDYYQNSGITTYLSKSVKTTPVFAGLSYYIKLDNFSIEPGFLVRLDKNILPNTIDLYFWNNDNLEKGIYYTNKSPLRIGYTPAISLSYLYPFQRGLRIGIQMTYRYLFSNSNIEYHRREIQVASGTVVESAEKITGSYASSYIGFGFIVRLD